MPNASLCIIATSLLLCVITQAAEPVTIDWEKARQHWSFVPPKKQALPKVKDAAWPRGRVDHFILANMEAKELTPSREADVRTLLRRMTFDLTGLPPTPEEVQTFMNDSRPDAYARLVDDLLGRRAFGERLASVWLNLARYAEDQAHQVGNNSSLNYPNAWRYRDWVISACEDEIENVYAEDDPFQECNPVGTVVINFGRNHISKLDEWLRLVELEGWEVEVVAW